jgi:1,2-diacylglycerol-3-alpha-glucose alpha-1,2-galactosyltransferase
VHVIPDSIRGSLPLWRLLMPFIRWYFRRVYSYADVCIAISPMVEKAIRALKAKTRIVRIYNPIHADKYSPTPERRAQGRKLLGLSEDGFVILGVGQLEGRKGVEDFIDIAAAVPNATFVWVGGRPFGVMTEGIAKLNKRISAVKEHVKFPGLFELSDMPYVYNSADLLLFTSYQENCPLVPIEAAAAGLPVIYRDIPEYRELYENPYLKVKDTAEFIELTKKMIADSSFREQGRNISKTILRQFAKDEIRKRLLALYHELA